MICICRNCNKEYNPFKSRADLRGYCSQKCLKEKAHKYGCKQGTYDYAILHRLQAVGDLLHPDYKSYKMTLTRSQIGVTPAYPEGTEEDWKAKLNRLNVSCINTEHRFIYSVKLIPDQLPTIKKVMGHWFEFVETT